MRPCCGSGSVSAELEEVFEKYGVFGHIREAVLRALRDAPEDGTIIIIWWNERRLQELKQPGQTKAVLVDAIKSATPNCTPSPICPDEVFSFLSDEDLNEVYKIRHHYIWAFGDEDPSCPLLNRLAVGRTIAIRAINNEDNEVPSFVVYNLFEI